MIACQNAPRSQALYRLITRMGRLADQPRRRSRGLSPLQRLVATTLCAVSLGSLGPAAATELDPRWRLVGQNSSVHLYYDPAGLVRDGDIRKVRELQDLAEADPDGVRSRVYLNEYDCRNQMHRIGQMQSHAGPRLTGQRRFDVREMGYWRRIPAGSVFAQVYLQVCPDGKSLPVEEPLPPLQRLFGTR